MAVRKEYTFTYKDISERKRKNLAILDCIRRKGEVSRSDISKESGINIVSVSNYIMSYIKKGLVLECGRDVSTGGRRPELVRLNLRLLFTAVGSSRPLGEHNDAYDHADKHDHAGNGEYLFGVPAKFHNEG